MTSIAVLMFAFVLLVVGFSLLARTEIRRRTRRRAAYAEVLARMAAEMEQLAVRIGEAFTPAVQRATASIVTFGEALAKIHDNDLDEAGWPPEATSDPPAYPFSLDRHVYEAPEMAAWRAEHVASKDRG